MVKLEDSNGGSQRSNPTRAKEAEGSLDIRVFLFKALPFWPLFVASLAVFVLSALLFNRYTTQKFSTSTSLLISTDNSGANAGLEAVMSAIGYYNPELTLENELFILKSDFLLERTLKSLHLEVSYFKEGRVRANELYLKQPFVVEFDPSHPQPAKADIRLEFISENSFVLDLSEDPLSFVTYGTNEIQSAKDLLGDNVQLTGINGEYSIGEWIEGKGFKFRVNLNPFSGMSLYEDRFIFKYNLFSDMVETFKEKLKIETSIEGSSGVRIAVEGSIPDKDVSFLNAFTNTYLQYGLEQNNLITQNTLNFLQSELVHISDSLFKTEQILEDFRTANKIVDLDITGSKSFNELADLEYKLAEEQGRKRYLDYLLERFTDDTEMAGAGLFAGGAEPRHDPEPYSADLR